MGIFNVVAVCLTYRTSEKYMMKSKISLGHGQVCMSLLKADELT